MATRKEFAAFVTEQLGGEAQGVTCRKMFGEYGLHCFGKFFGMICADALYLKPTPAGLRFLQMQGALAEEPPYEGAKNYYRMDRLDDRDFLQEARQITVDALAEPKPKKPRSHTVSNH